jgi:hypothetical protein
MPILDWLLYLSCIGSSTSYLVCLLLPTVIRLSIGIDDGDSTRLRYGLWRWRLIANTPPGRGRVTSPWIANGYHDMLSITPIASKNMGQSRGGADGITIHEDRKLKDATIEAASFGCLNPSTCSVYMYLILQCISQGRGWCRREQRVRARRRQLVGWRIGFAYHSLLMSSELWADKARRNLKH